MNYRKNINAQHGSALIVSLSILLVLTILGVSSMRTISLEEKMAGNTRDSQVAFEAAEASLREAEQYLDGIANLADFSATGGIGGYYMSKGNGDEAWTDEDNWTNSTHEVSVGDYTGNNDIARQPRYMIQVVDSTANQGKNKNIGKGYKKLPIKDIKVYQITARGFGVSPNSRIMLQTYYGTL